jgi:hypothetical protein
MILQLSNQKIKVLPMRIPEPKNYLQIRYGFEAGTNHLYPVLTIGKEVYRGDQVFIDVTKIGLNEQTTFKVELLDSNQQVIKTYTMTVQQHDYILFGQKPLRPDVDMYIKELEAEIIRLKEIGEVI